MTRDRWREMVGNRWEQVVALSRWWPYVRGIGRVADNPKAVMLYFDRSLTDDEMREIHDQLNGKEPIIEPSN